MRIAITGGTGSLGRALIRRLTVDGAERIVTFSRDEQKRIALAKEFAWHPGVKVYAGDVRDAVRLPDMFHDCEVVVHAAARKVVSGSHDEPRELLQTNVIGTQNVLAAARAAGVRKVLFISSDKAVHAENTYGVSKALAEQLVISENARAWPRGLRLSVIRYGNVLASNGSVVKIWRELLAAGRPLPISDLRMTRFWLSLDDAVSFVLRALADLRGGETFVPILKAAPLLSIAKALAVNAKADAKMESLGIRPGGEKLFEELLSADEVRRTVVRNGFFVVMPPTSSDSWDSAPWLGERIADGFEYRSDTWDQQWTVDELRDLLGEGVADGERKRGASSVA